MAFRFPAPIFPLLIFLTGICAAFPSGFVFAESGNIVCESDCVSIAFTLQGAVSRFHDKAGHCDISHTNDGGLWLIDIVAEGKTRTLAPVEAERFSHETSGSGELRMSWTGFPGMAKDISVGVTVRLDTKAPLSFWKLHIRKPSSVRVSEVRFPQVDNLARREGEALAVPVWTGQLLPNPRSVLCASDGARLAWNYPGMMAMQCVAYIAKDASGLYAACDDTAAFRKTFAFSGGKSGKVAFEFVHYPENGAEGREEWRMPYAAILGALHGDWYDAAERYRTWALQQSWAKESRMRRGLVPEWLSETGMWIWNRGRSDGVLPPAIALQEKIGLPVSVFWHWWHGCPYDAGFPEYLPPREGEEHFREAVSEAHAHGVRCIVYMNQRLWGMSTDSWRAENAERFAVKAEDGKVRPEVYNIFTKSPMASMCIATPFWRGTYAGIAQRAIAELGVDGIYMDQACDSMPCYDPSHGHAIGGGRYWLEGFRALSESIRNSDRAKEGSFGGTSFLVKRSSPEPLQEKRGGLDGQRQSPASSGRVRETSSSREEEVSREIRSEQSVALTGEGCCEAWLPYLDAMLTLQVSKERYSAPTDPWEPIPFFHAVYHSVATTYGSYSSLTMPPYDDLWPKASAPREPLALLDRKFSRQFYLEQARAFVWGQQPTLANFLPNQLDDRAEELDYVTRIAKVRHHAEKYLARGEFLRPPQLRSCGEPCTGVARTVESARKGTFPGMSARTGQSAPRSGRVSSESLGTPIATSPFSRLSIYAGQGEHLTEFEKTHPLALASAWRAPDGNVAIAIASVADEPLPISLSWNPSEYQMPSQGTLSRIAETGSIPIEPFQSPPSSHALTLPPRAICLLEFVNESPAA